MVGDEASQLRSMLEVNYPMENGIVRNWEDMIHVWDYTFQEKLKEDPRQCKVRRGDGKLTRSTFFFFFEAFILLYDLIVSLIFSLSLSLQVLLTEPPMNPTKNREKMIEVHCNIFQTNGSKLSFFPLCTHTHTHIIYTKITGDV